MAAARSSVPTESLGIHMSRLVEYNLSELGPWAAVGGVPEAEASVWESPDPHQPGEFIYYAKRSGGIYLDGNLEPICFEGNLRRPGFPRPEEAAVIMSPPLQWELSLSAAEYCDYLGLE